MESKFVFGFLQVCCSEICMKLNLFQLPDTFDYTDGRHLDAISVFMKLSFIYAAQHITNIP